jgi:hypothetical protein
VITGGIVFSTLGCKGESWKYGTKLIKKNYKRELITPEVMRIHTLSGNALNVDALKDLQMA